MIRYVIAVDLFVNIFMGSSVFLAPPLAEEIYIWWKINNKIPNTPGKSGTSVCHDDQEYITPPQESGIRNELLDATKRKEPR